MAVSVVPKGTPANDLVSDRQTSNLGASTDDNHQGRAGDDGSQMFRRRGVQRLGCRHFAETHAGQVLLSLELDLLHPLRARPGPSTDDAVIPRRATVAFS